ncbi:putative adhesin [Citrobacter portucalensis]|uniref:putative adhesin n=1 Tax=Citrobacter portucalensis TaxID=1639133 RepID=UPI00288AE29C|nr:hypothetical protein [Citrobacter portucalensis]WNI88019.1 hypothetical protein RIK60_09700 [Citrobacter portucalensis]
MIRHIHHHRHISGSHQRIQEPIEVGRLGNRTVRVRNAIRNFFHRSGTSHSQEIADKKQKICERSVKLGAGNNKDAPSPLRRGPVGIGELSTGSGITVSKSWVTEEARCNLEKKYNISITPVIVEGKEIGYVFGQNRSDIGKIYLNCHGTSKNVNDFEKPVGVALKFVTPKDHNLIASSARLADNVAEGRVLYETPSEQTNGADNKKTLKNYSLSGFTERFHYGNSENCAISAGALKFKGKPINLMVLNPNAKGIHLTDVIQGVNDTFHRMPELILAHCRGENNNSEDAMPSLIDNILRKPEPVTKKMRWPEFMPNSEKRMAGNWTDEINKPNSEERMAGNWTDEINKPNSEKRMAGNWTDEVNKPNSEKRMAGDWRRDIHKPNNPF